MIKRYNKGEYKKIPQYLLWGMIDEKQNTIVNLKIISLHKLLEDRKNNYTKDKSYKIKNDSEKFNYKENNDGTSFIIIKTEKYTIYNYEIK